MKRFLLFAMMCVCASVGAWATTTIGSTTWCQYNSYADQENVLTIYVSEPGELATAIAAQDFTNVQILHVSARGRTADLLQLTDEDKAALANVNVKTIEMMRAYVEPYTITNSNVERIILPYNWTKEQVKAVGQANSTSANFEACISMNDQDAYEQRTGDAALIAYLNKPNTLKDAIMRTWNDTHGYAPLGNIVYQGGGDCSRLKYLTVMGNFCARDISREGTYDENGHYVTNGVPDENILPENNYNKNTAGGNYYTAGTTPGALSANTGDLYVLDLRDAYVPDEYAADIVFPYSQMGGTNLREIWMPEDPRFKTIPADYLNVSSAVHQICIPGNIEVIKTRAFAGASMNYIWTTGPDATVRYDNGATFITGAGTDSEVRTQRYKTQVGENYTATENFDPTVEYPVFQDGDDNSFNYGTFTLPAGLRLIERYAFYSSTSVSDVYILNPVAPECHVDAFNSSMYHANNTVKADNIREEEDEDGNKIKIITREAYNNGINQPMAMLHYPQDTTDPNIQRYTDPSRQYSIATGDRDGKGNMLYFPTQTEFEVAEWEGTHGYLWNAWNIDRTWYNQEVMLGTGGGWYGDAFGTTGGYTSAGQQKANDFYTANPDTITSRYNPNGKIDRSFYDVTNNETYSQPTGLQPYYNTVFNGFQLYPQAKSETSNYVYVRDDNGDYVKDPTSASTTVFRAYAGSADDQLERFSLKTAVVTDEQGNPTYDTCSEGNFVEDYEWQPNDACAYVKETRQDGYVSTNIIVDGVNTYYSDAEGTTAVTPQVGTGMFIESGTENDYSIIDANSEQPGARSEYYTTSDGGQTYSQTNLQFSGNPVLYYPTGNTSTKYTATTKLKYGKTHYYDANGNEVIPTLIPGNPSNGLVYYKDENNVEHETTVFIPGQGNYYVKTKNTWNDDYSLVGNVNDNYPSVNLDGTYYYEDGVEEEYVVAQDFVPGTTYYTENNGSYSEATIQWYMITGGGQNLYYVSGSHPAYISAQGEEYDASTTYYSDKNGTEATTIRLNTQYYIPNYVDEYRIAQTGDEGLPHYDKNYLGTYRPVASTDDANEPRYCIVTEPFMSDTPITYTVANDYRGWHQFVLAGYGYNGVVPNEPIRSFISDNDWWTICEPYDLRYKDMIEFFGTNVGALYKKPYLSKLMYVIRDVEKGKITLMFSKNLMEYKEVIASDGQVHGTIDDVTKWIGNGEGQYADEAALRAANPVILHKGVPYLIKPNLLVDDDGNITGTRQFNVYKTDNIELYNRLNEAATLGAGAQASMIYDGEYTVPAYVVGLGKEGAGTEAVEATGTKTIPNKDGSSFTYKDSENGGKLVYGGKEVDYKISSAFTYTFVGSLYNSLMPQYCYFLGWDSTKGKAAFWYSAVQDKSGWNWNNETGIICPNFPTSTKIHSATGFNDPARWTIAGANGTSLQPDDINMPSGAGAKSYTMDFGGSNFFEIDEEEDGIVTEIEEVKAQGNGVLNVYSVNGVYMGNSVEGLAKGLYVVNGQKYVVK